MPRHAVVHRLDADRAVEQEQELKTNTELTRTINRQAAFQHFLGTASTPQVESMDGADWNWPVAQSADRPAGG